MKIGMVIGGLLLVAMSFFMLFSYQPEILCFLVLGAGAWMLMHSKKERDTTPLLKKQGTQTILASLLCIVLGLLVGYIVLLIINPEGAWNALSTIISNFKIFSKADGQTKNLANTIVKTVPLLLCGLSVLFAYKVGMFNIGAAGQYVAGAGIALFLAIGLGVGFPTADQAAVQLFGAPDDIARVVAPMIVEQEADAEGAFTKEYTALQKKYDAANEGKKKKDMTFPTAKELAEISQGAEAVAETEYGKILQSLAKTGTLTPAEIVTLYGDQDYSRRETYGNLFSREGADVTVDELLEKYGSQPVRNSVSITDVLNANNKIASGMGISGKLTEPQISAGFPVKTEKTPEESIAWLKELLPLADEELAAKEPKDIIGAERNKFVIAGSGLTFAASVQRVADLVGGMENVTVDQIKAIYSDMETIETVKLADAVNEIAEKHGGLEKMNIGQLINGMGIQTGMKGGWVICVLGAILAGALLGALSGFLKAFRNVNEVISGIMLNWITLYLINMLLAGCMDQKMNETWSLKKFFPNAMLPTAGVDGLFHGQSEQTTIAIPIAILVAVLIWYLLTKTKKGYELRATGLNKEAAKYAGMKGRTNTITTMAIAGALAGLGAALFYLTDNTKWSAGQATVPAMGFNGIAAAFLGGLHPIGAIFSSFFIQHITDGGSFMEKIYPAEIASLISSVIIYMCAFVLFIRQTMNKTLGDRDARVHSKLVKETKGILHGELQEDFDQSVAAVVNAEIGKQAALAPAAAEAAEQADKHAATPDELGWSPAEQAFIKQVLAESEDAKKDKEKKKDKKDKKEKKGGSDK